MQLDEWPNEWTKAWAAHGALLQRSVAIDERLLRETMFKKVRFALVPYLAWRAIELVLCALAALVGFSVLADRIADPRYVLVAGSVAVYFSGIAAYAVVLMVKSSRLDYDGPVTAIQRDVERIKLAEYRAFKWALLGGVGVWLPAPLVLFEALTGAGVLARVDLGWVALNMLVGLVLLAIGHAWSRRYVERHDLSPFARRVVDALTGRSLRVVSGHLAELSRFERE